MIEKLMKDKIMNMTPNECAAMMVKKDEEIYKLEKAVERLRKKCKRYEKQLTNLHLNGDFK